MIRQGMWTFAILLALAVALDNTAAAQTAAAKPTLREAVTVTSDVVRIGDLVDNAGAAAGIPIFRSPDVGTTGTVATYQIVEALRSHDLTAVNTDGIREVQVARAGRMISVKDIQARIVRAFVG